MFKEEKIINGVLHWRGIPGGEWHVYSPEELTRKLSEVNATLIEQSDDVDYAYFKSVLKSNRVAKIIEKSVSRTSALHDLMMVYCINHNEAAHVYDQHCGVN